ncbi:outer membrane beta-barrel protein [Marinobacter hydrocarbonoclasticus]|nr:outer membrane beta-barrel protein [Marinobacter nauticus]
MSQMTIRIARNQALLFSAVSACSLILSAYSQAAQGHDQGFYLGVGLGYASYSDDIYSSEVRNNLLVQEGITPGETFSSSSNGDDSSFAYKLFGGYRFNAFFAVEAFYADFGDVSGGLQWSGQGTITDATVPQPWDVDFQAENMKVEAQALGFSAVGSYPVADNVSLYAKLGAFWYNTDSRGGWVVDATSDIGGIYMTEGTWDKSNDDYSWLGAIGLTYAFSDRFDINLEWETYQDIEFEYGKSEKADFDVGLFNVSLSYDF